MLNYRNYEHYRREFWKHKQEEEQRRRELYGE
jgi:hypothetical protein